MMMAGSVKPGFGVAEISKFVNFHQFGHLIIGHFSKFVKLVIFNFSKRYV